MKKVNVEIVDKNIPTYKLGEPEKNPVFFEKRVYQGSSGKVYPVPFIDKVYDHKEDKLYKTIVLENDYIRLVLLPEIGGRIFEAQDKTNDNFDFFYKQDVIKPALVGLAGPWISGGVEFNWPQHHRPGTYMPCDFSIEHEDDGAVTVWMSEYDPINRLKGMHGIRLKPDSSLIELRARLYNRTPVTQTFLWWANVAVRVHDDYQSFFPTDVHYVADHAVRAITGFPESDGDYYGIPYNERQGENDLRWYKNIPVPTSYMVCETNYDFFGGYDHAANGGFIHFADKHVAPGKKQWTWGNDEFGKAWDRELTDNGGPYIELMSGVYTDNQPDFSYLLPFETKTFSQYWWPFKNIGPVQNANEDLGLKLSISNQIASVGVVASKEFDNVKLLLSSKGVEIYSQIINVSPASSYENNSVSLEKEQVENLRLAILDTDGIELITYEIEKPSTDKNRKLATEPLKPVEVETNLELNQIGEHLELYRHPTRYPEAYWTEAIERDPNDFKAMLSLAKLYLKQGDFTVASKSFAKVIEITTDIHPNPISGEAHYYCGLANLYLKKYEEAYRLFYKATWNFEWRSSGYFMLANISCIKGDYKKALTFIEESLNTNSQNNKAIVLKAVVKKQLGNDKEAIVILEDLLKIDALDQWANFELALLSNNFEAFKNSSRNDSQTIIDIVFDYTKAGFYKKAIACLEWHHKTQVIESATPNPLSKSLMTRYILGWLYEKVGNVEVSAAILEEASKEKPDYFFPSRINEQIILKWALSKDIDRSNISFALGNYYFDKKRHADAIRIWEIGVEDNSQYASLYRNLGIAYWNYNQEEEKSLKAYEKAIELAPKDMRVLFEYDQLKKKQNIDPIERLAFLKPFESQLLFRDDFSVEYAALYNFSGDYTKVIELLESKNFHPWEGGEGQVLRQYSYACIKLGEKALENSKPQQAFDYFQKAINTPDSLGEKYHPLQAKANIYYWLGKASLAIGNAEEANSYFTKSATEDGDFLDMAVSAHSEMTYYKALSLKELGEIDEANLLLNDFKKFALDSINKKAEIDYFATSLPLLLVFDDNIEQRSLWENKYLLALAELGLNNLIEANKLLKEVLSLNAMHVNAKETSKVIEQYEQI